MNICLNNYNKDKSYQGRAQGTVHICKGVKTKRRGGGGASQEVAKADIYLVNTDLFKK